MRVSVVQTKPSYLNRQKNLFQIEKLIRRVKSDVIICPELATSGYNFQSKFDLKKVAESAKSGPTSKFLKKWASKKKVVIVLGFPEVANGRFYNSAFIVTPEKIKVYRKAHLFSSEKKFFNQGNHKPPIVRWKNMKIGVFICFDWLFPEMARSLALRGADLIAHPSNLVMPYAPTGMKIRSLENHVFSVTANRVGSEFGLKFIGQSQILGIRGEILASLGSSQVGVKTVTINPKTARDKWITSRNHVLKDRRQSLYR